MLSLPPSVRVFVARAAVDVRRNIDGLAAAVIDVVDEDPQSGHLFVSLNRRRTHVKCLVRDRSGYGVHCTRLDHGRFRVFDRAGEEDGAYRLKAHELLLVLEGIDLRGSRRRLRRFAHVGSQPTRCCQLHRGPAVAEAAAGRWDRF